MKKLSILLLVGVLLGACSAWAGIIGSTDPSQFDDPVAWCANFTCDTNPATQYGTPQTWTSVGGKTGLVGLVSSQNMEMRQQGLTWNGNFAAGEGIVYNGVLDGNNPGGILVSLDSPQLGMGAFIQDNFFLPFTATITLYDAGFNLLGTYSAPGVSDTNVGTALFIGAYDSILDVSYALFDVTDGVNPEDFAIGTLKLQTEAPVPEPGTLFILGPSALGLYGILRRRVGRKEVQ